MYIASVLSPQMDRVGVLDEARKHMGMNHVQFAAFLQISYDTWCRWRRAPATCPQIVVIHTEWPIEGLPLDGTPSGEDGHE